MIFCGIFDGHGPWGHLVAKTVRQLMPSFLLCNWQETLAQFVVKPDSDEFGSSDGCRCQFDIWKQSYFKACSAIDYQLAQLPGIDSFYSGSTALTIVRQVIKFIVFGFVNQSEYGDGDFKFVHPIVDFLFLNHFF